MPVKTTRKPTGRIPPESLKELVPGQDPTLPGKQPDPQEQQAKQQQADEDRLRR